MSYEYKETYLVFDIETSAIDFQEFSTSQQEYILRRANTEEEKQQKLFEMALSPLTSEVVCIGLKLITKMVEENGDSSWKELNSAAFINDKSFEDGKFEIVKLPLTQSNGYYYNEKNLLESFWKILAKYNDTILVSFNGRNFDAPFLMLRSALLGIRPSRNLMKGTKFNYPQHIDLIDELTFYNGTAQGATKRYNFDFYAQAFGIKSPKSEGVDGSMVTTMFKEGKADEIAEYCLRDVKATWELFLKWYEYLKF